MQLFPPNEAAGAQFQKRISALTQKVKRLQITVVGMGIGLLFCIIVLALHLF